MKCVCAVVSRCSRWWSFNVEANSANTGSDGEGKSEVTDETIDTATEALKTQLADTEVQFCFVLQFCHFVYGLHKPSSSLRLSDRIYSHINRPANKPTPIPAAENLAKISDLRISR